jgi:hypothetical protein
MPEQTVIHLKINAELKDAFDNKASKFGKPSIMLRTLIEAFVQDRVKIIPTEEQMGLFDLTNNVSEGE